MAIARSDSRRWIMDDVTTNPGHLVARVPGHVAVPITAATSEAHPVELRPVRKKAPKAAAAGDSGNDHDNTGIDMPDA